MATTRILSRSLQTTKQTLSSLHSRSYTSAVVHLSTPPPSSLSSSLSLLRLRPLVAANFHSLSTETTTIRSYCTSTSASLNVPIPTWSNQPLDEKILPPGCDFDHWLIVMEKPEGDPTRDEIIDSYIKTLAQIVGSEEEARRKIYSVSFGHYNAFGALVSKNLQQRSEESALLTGRLWAVLPGDAILELESKQVEKDVALIIKEAGWV